MGTRRVGVVTLAIAGTLFLAGGGMAYEGAEVKDGGSISGTVKFAGQPPAPKKLEITKDQEVCGREAKVSEETVVSADKGLKNAVVSLAGIPKGKPLAQAAFSSPVLDQNGCAFKPHVVLVPAGGNLDILNSDGILHNFHTFSAKNVSVNKAQPKFKKKMTEKFEQAEIIKITCDAHSWMNGWIVVAEHPYYAVSDASGKFKLENIPAGTYQLQVWHETLGTVVQEVTVRAREESALAVEMGKK